MNTHGFTRTDAAAEEKEALLTYWEKLPDFVDEMSGMIVHEVKCRKCKAHETYSGSMIPKNCYICEERRYL